MLWGLGEVEMFVGTGDSTVALVTGEFEEYSTASLLSFCEKIEKHEHTHTHICSIQGGCAGKLCIFDHQNLAQL